MRIDIITLFPEFFEQLMTHSMTHRAIKNGKVIIVTHNLRDYARDKYGTVDDRPYGGGVGMVLKVDVMDRALSEVKMLNQGKVILLTPQGELYRQAKAKELSKETGLILICGHYEGFDERIRALVDYEISIGDYVLTGGEIAAQIIVDTVTRLLPGVLGHDESSIDESHSEGLLEYPQYTRPEDYKGMKVPEILLSGNHPEIEKWRREESKKRTLARRPDLISKLK